MNRRIISNIIGRGLTVLAYLVILRWLASFTAVPALCAVASVAVVRGLSPATTGRVASAAVILLGVAVAMLATVYSMPGPKRVGAA
jgi:hypothetical protein